MGDIGLVIWKCLNKVWTLGLKVEGSGRRVYSNLAESRNAGPRLDGYGVPIFHDI